MYNVETYQGKAPYARRAAPAKLIIVKMLINLALESIRAPRSLLCLSFP